MAVHDTQCCSKTCASTPSTAPQTAIPIPAGMGSSFSIENMDCPTEEALIRDKLSGMAQVSGLQFNLLQRRLTVMHTGPQDAVMKALHAIGMNAVPLAADGSGSDSPATQHHADKLKWMKLGAGVLLAAGAEAAAWSAGSDMSPVVIALSVSAVLLTGLSTYKKGWIALRNRNLNINALMTIAVTGAILIGQWPEAAMVMALFALAEAIEALSLERARNAIRGLMAMTPDKATVRQHNGEWMPVDAARVAVGAMVRVGPGERIALDGVLTEGRSSVNQAPITGESMPVAKGIGDQVFAGTVNESGSFAYKVSALQAQSTLSRIIRAVEEAQGARAPTQRFVDRFAKVYTPLVFAAALGVVLVPPLAFGMDWLPWAYKGLVLLVIACPCALVISTPVAVVSGLAAAARSGILIKGGAYLEEGHKLRSLALDKTGTITQGMPAVTDIVPIASGAADWLRIAASLAARSDHPMSAAISRYWAGAPSPIPLHEVHGFEALAGRGTKGTIDGTHYYLGNHRLQEELGICTAAMEETLSRIEADGKSAVVISSESAPLAVIGVADTIRESSRQAIAELHALGVRTIMLTGDNALTAAAIARDVGIDEAHGNLLPEEKLEAVGKEMEKYRHVGMVGDGINDAPALAKSSIGFAMGAAGTDTAIETADVALMDDDLRKIAQFIRLSRKTATILRQNIAFALTIKAVFLGLALAGTATLWMAVFADMGASLLVVFNGLRLLRISPDRTRRVVQEPALPECRARDLPCGPG